MLTVPACAAGRRTATPWSDDALGKADDNTPQPHSAHQKPDVDAAGARSAAVDVMIETLPGHAFQFFAVEIDFAHGTWAHGGLQSGNEADWGGLDGAYGYNFQGHQADVLEHLQNAPGRMSSVAWQTGVWYHFAVDRIEQETLPAGSYSVLDEPPTTIDHPRTLWRWDFTVTRTDGTAVWNQPFYTDSDTFTGWSYWTETGYGETCADIVTAHWRSPRFDGVTTGWASPTRIVKTIGQSTCSNDATSDIATDDIADQGTVQYFGAPRAPGSMTGQALYAIGGPIGDEYYRLGGATSALGYVVDDERDTICGGGRARDFQTGVIVAATGQPAHAVIGPIADAWNASFADCGSLGFPLADGQLAGTTTTQPFEGGTIASDSADGSVVITPRA